MRDGFVKVAARSPKVIVADVAANTEALIADMREVTQDERPRIIVYPELCITGYTCEDLFWQDALISAAEEGVARVREATHEVDALVLVGAPVRVGAKLYNCAVVLAHGHVLGVVPKKNLPNYNEFYELRHFVPAPRDTFEITFLDERVPFGTKQLFTCRTMPDLCVGVELCEDLWVVAPPSQDHARAGATIICNLSASDAVVGKADYRCQLVSGQSARLVAGYIYASAGWGESTQDLVFSAHDLIAENGVVLAEAKPFGTCSASSEIDVNMLAQERRRISTFDVDAASGGYVRTSFELELETCALTRWVDPHPFVPADSTRRHERSEEVFSIQAYGLAKRLQHTHAKTAVIGVSGGLDSTLALLVMVRAFDILGLDRKGIVAVTMPGFGTTTRTHNNALDLTACLGCTLREVSIAKAVRQHFKDIGHAEDDLSVTYENAQARERTQILMDIANDIGGMVVGTGDLSELALGWATYNADHMSMYGVNAGVPKTLVRHLVRYVADISSDDEVKRVLLDVLDTPVSPELLPADAHGEIAQKTEDLVGPYELHDFFLYQVLRRNFAPRKVARLACYALEPEGYSKEEIISWLKVFYRRFFSQQFKRSCLPDGPKVGTVAVSPRGDLRMPSDASCALWLKELDESFL
ncbi:MAG: NAD(+) synthase [Atopobiaceae bacterium]|jgi:NAD+ synthase (glutamine-hydrolysing)